MHIIFNYNPYSIVNERWIAKIDAERNRPTTVVFTANPAASLLRPNPSRRWQDTGEIGGADRARTDDPLLAKQVLSQLSYSPRFATMNDER